MFKTLLSWYRLTCKSDRTLSKAYSYDEEIGGGPRTLLAARHDHLAAALRAGDHLPVSAGEGRGHQYVAGARRPGTNLHQQICVPAGAHRARRYCRIPLSARYVEELHQARDRCRW